MRMHFKLLSLLGGALLAASVAEANGFQINLQGQKQIGMGHAGTGLALDQACIFFNPGALSHLRRNGFMIGVSPLFSKTTYQAFSPDQGRARTENPLGTPFQVYASFGGAQSPLRLGIGIYTPFGSSINWGDHWQGRFVIQQASLETIFLQPTASYRLSDKVGIGLGFVYSTGTVHLARGILLPGDLGEGRVRLEGQGSGLGFNAGLYVQATDQFSLGLSYRSKVKMKVKDGEADFTTPPVQAIAARFPDTRFKSSLPLPANITFGLGFRASEKLTLTTDIQHVRWRAYRSLRFDYADQVNGTTFSDSPRNYKNTFAFRLGGQYQASGKLALRAGGFFDRSPVQDGYLTPETPDADAIGTTVGLSWRLTGKLGLDASFLYLNRRQRSDAANLSGGVPGTFKTEAYIPGMALSYHF